MSSSFSSSSSKDAAAESLNAPLMGNSDSISSSPPYSPSSPYIAPNEIADVDDDFVESSESSSIHQLKDSPLAQQVDMEEKIPSSVSSTLLINKLPAALELFVETQISAVFYKSALKAGNVRRELDNLLKHQLEGTFPNQLANVQPEHLCHLLRCSDTFSATLEYQTLSATYKTRMVEWAAGHLQFFIDIRRAESIYTDKIVNDFSVAPYEESLRTYFASTNTTDVVKINAYLNLLREYFSSRKAFFQAKAANVIEEEKKKERDNVIRKQQRELDRKRKLEEDTARLAASSIEEDFNRNGLAFFSGITPTFTPKKVSTITKTPAPTLQRQLASPPPPFASRQQVLEPHSFGRPPITGNNRPLHSGYGSTKTPAKVVIRHPAKSSYSQYNSRPDNRGENRR